MEAYDIYRDIAERTNGDIYIGVVGSCADREIHIHQTVYGFAGAAEY